MSVQFCAANTGRILVMPLMTQGSAGNCGIFPQRWESIIGRILGMIKSGDMSGNAPVQSISNVVVSSFSAGITYSHYFRKNANLGARLTGVIDFDGSFSSYKNLSASIINPYGKVIKFKQMVSNIQTIPSLAAQNIFPMDPVRLRKISPPMNSMQLHGTIPQYMMFIGERRTYVQLKVWNSYFKNIYTKLHVNCGREAVVKALKEKIV